MKSILKILNSFQKKKLLVVVILIILFAFLELFFFSLLLPLINFFIGNSQNTNSLIFKYFDNTDFKYLLSIFIFVFIFRTIVSVILSFKKHYLTKNINDYFSHQLFKKYLDQNYLFFMQNNSANFISKIITQVEKFSYILIDSYITLFVEIVLVLTISYFLLKNFFFETIIFTIILILFFLIFYFLVRKKMVLFGEKKIFYDKKKVNILQQSFYIIQNIKLDNLEESFLKNFKNYTKESSNSNLYLSTISELARPLMETLLILVVFFIIFIFYYYFDLPKEQIIPMLGLYIFAMFRILPSCNKILSCYNNIRYHESIIKDFNETLELEDYDNNDSKFIGEFSFQKNIFLKKIDYAYQDGIKVLNNVNFEIKKNQSIGIFGESGSGKSTLLNVISNLLLPSQGEILIDGNKLKLPSKKLQSKIGYVPQKAYLIDDTIISNIILGKHEEEYNYNLFKKVIIQANLLNVVNSFPEKENTIIGERGVRISGGQQQRLSIARALYKNPEIIIFDEATNALDKSSETEVFDTIFSLKNKITTIIVSHNQSLFEKCDEIYFMKKGELIKYK